MKKGILIFILVAIFSSLTMSQNLHSVDWNNGDAGNDNEVVGSMNGIATTLTFTGSNSAAYGNFFNVPGGWSSIAGTNGVTGISDVGVLNYEGALIGTLTAPETITATFTFDSPVTNPIVLVAFAESVYNFPDGGSIVVLDNDGGSFVGTTNVMTSGVNTSFAVKYIGVYSSITFDYTNGVYPNTADAISVAYDESLSIDPPGNALYFNGIDEYTYVDNSEGMTAPTTTQDLTVEAWIKPASNSETQVIISKYSGGSVVNSNYFIARTASGQIFLSANGTNTMISNGTVPVDRWSHIAVVFKNGASNTKIYINGVLDNSGSLNYNTINGAGWFIMGRLGGTMGAYTNWNGEIDEVRIWDNERSLSDIQNNLYNELADPLSEINLVSYYTCNEGAGTTTSDLKGSNHQILYNMDNTNWTESYAMVYPQNLNLTNCGSKLNISWEESVVGEFDGYYLEVATDSDFSTYVATYNSKDMGTALNEEITGLTQEDTYYVRVRCYKTDLGDVGSNIVSDNITLVSDVTNPVTPTLADVTGECSATATAPTTTDNCADPITGTTSDNLVYTTQGTYTITWNFDDGNGNSIDVTQNVVINDVTNPETPTIDNVTGECSATVTVPTTNDNCSDEITGETTDALFYDVQGTYSITWTFDDNNGNIITYTQTVTVNDITPPETPTIDNVTGECSATATAPTTTDNCASDITATTSDALTYDEQGTYTITWNFDDGNGNSIDLEQTVIVEDVTDPTIACPENQEFDLSQGETAYTVSGDALNPTSADDNCGSIGVENDFNTTETLDAAEFPVGTTTVEWTVMDDAGNFVTCTFDVQVNAFVAISELAGFGVNIYPNPSSGVFNVEIQDNYDITITDISGRTIEQLIINNEELTIDLTNNANGIYFIKFQNSETVKTIKLIKQ